MDLMQTPSGDPSPQRGRNALAPAPSRSLQRRERRPGDEPRKTSRPINLAFILRALRRWWKIATPIALVLAGLVSFLVWFFHEPQYFAQAWLRMQLNQSASTIFPERINTRAFVQTQLELLTSPVVLQPVIAKPDIARFPEIEKEDDPIAWLRKEIRVESLRGSELFTVNFSGPDAKRAARIVNAVVESYFKIQSQEEARRTRRTIELLAEEQERRADEVTQLRKVIRDLSIKQNRKDPFAEEDPRLDALTLAPLAKLTNELNEVELDRAILQAELVAVKEAVADAEIEASPDEIERLIRDHPDISQGETVLAAMQVRMDEIKSISKQGDQDARFVRLRNEYQSTQEALAELRTTLTEEYREAFVKDAVNRQRIAVAKMEGNLKSLQLRETLLAERYEKAKADVDTSTDHSLDLEFRRTELLREEKVFEMIAEKVLALKARDRNQPETVRLWQSASPPVAPREELPYKILFLALGTTILLPFALAVLWEHVVRRVDDPDQLWEADLAVVGEIARLPSSSRFSGFSSKNVGRDVSLFEESIDSLRTCLVLSEPTDDARVLVVSSAVSGEGKTSVAAQLAVSIARSSGEKTLLIDADMRSPDIHNVFDIPNEPGLAQVLGKECSTEEAIVTTWSNYVHLLPAGVLEASPHKLLGDGTLTPLLAQLRAEYKHIVIDTSPILSASESLVLAKAADAALLCAMRDVSRIDQVQKAYERLVNTGARAVGAVLNGVPTSRYAYLYGNYAYPRDS